MNNERRVTKDEIPYSVFHVLSSLVPTPLSFFILLPTLFLTLIFSACGPAPARTPASAVNTPIPSTPTPVRIEVVNRRPELPGRLLAVKAGNIYLWSGNTFAQLTTDGLNRQATWSPDSRRIAFIKVALNSSDVWVMNADGSGARSLTRNQSPIVQKNAWAFQPTWSPDGRQIAYLSDAGTQDLALWVMQSDGTGHRLLSSAAEGQGGFDTIAWSPDGGRIAAAVFKAGVSQIGLLNPTTRVWTILTRHEAGAYDPAWSPDGRYLSYVARQQGKTDVWVMRSDGSFPQRLTQTGLCRAPQWSPDGSQIAFLSGGGGGFDLAVMKVTINPGGDLKAGEAEILTRNADLDPGSGLSWIK